jgi:hypothetical protein
MRRTLFSLACLACLPASAFAAKVESISRLAAGPADVLFVADWKAASVHAIHLPPADKVPSGATFNILDLEALLSSQLGNAAVTVADMTVRPGTAEVYVAVSYGIEKKPALFVVTGHGNARRVDLDAAEATSVALRDAPTSTASFWKQTPERSFTVTDMKWRDGELYVAGLSNQDFSSTLRRVPYPFSGKQSMSSIEIFHGGHNLMETRAPIRAMSFAELGGKSYLVAAYTCTPLVLIPVDSLKNGAHVIGKTVAELGYGNTPAGMISYSVTAQGTTKDFIMLVNFNRVSDVVAVDELKAAASRPGIETQVPFGQITGVAVTEAPLAGALRIDNLDDKSFVVVRRDLQHDALQLVSIAKDLSFRMSDHVSEYAFPDFSFKGNAFQRTNIKPRQDVLLKDEGLPDLIRAE